MPQYHLAQINIARVLAPIDDLGGLKPCLSSWKSAGSRLAQQPDGLPCPERVALAPRFAPKDHEELIRKGEEFIEEWERNRE